MKNVIFFGFVICFALGKVSTAAEVRLVGGPTLYEGRLEVRKSNSDPWGTVCDDQFDNADASVVCRMLGFANTESSSIIDPNRFGPGSGKILLDEMRCIGNESDVSDCGKNEWGESDCGHTEDIGVSCLTPARLTDGLPPHSGRVEIQRKGSWESICYDEVNQSTAKVLCRMMALSTGDVEIKPNDSNRNISTSEFSCNGTEKDILQCRLSKSQCQSARSTSINCRTDVRLAGGPNQQEGRVEIYFQDNWGTVCDDSFDDNAASVVCRMLGFNPNGARARGRHYYGQGNGSIVIDNLRCSGNEADISECKSNMWGSHTNCDHKEDVSVDCGTEVRLADGPTRYSGRLEIKSKSSWDNMCEDSFDNNTGLVICKMLGFERGNLTIHKNAYYGSGAGVMVKYKLKCHGNETDIVNCRRDPISSCTGNSNVGINCYSVTPLRLQGGPTTYSGRVEVYLKEQSSWVGICNENYGFTIDDARVLCRMLGKPNMSPSFQDSTNIYDYVIRGEAISGMNCSGSEQDITDCVSDKRWLETSCNHPNYVGINCEPETNVRLVDGPSAKAGRVELLYNGTWGAVCADGFDIKDSDVVCSMLGYTQKSYLLQNDEFLQGNISTLVTNVQCKGHERDISDCRSERWTSGNCRSGINVGIACNSTVRLVNGTSERSGTVEIYHKQKWWAMCSDSIDENVADVVCRMAGFRYWNASVLEGSSFRKDARDFLINQITCNGSESDLASCNTSPWKNTSCSSGLAATVECKIPHTLIRLVGGKTRYSGRVHVFHNNKWGTICASAFSDENAQIVCLTLGYNFTSDITYSYNMYEYESNKVMISNMKCNGNETDISVCPSDYWDTGNGNCTPYYYQSVGINCLTTVRLQGGRTKAMGRVEVEHRGSFGTICKDNFAKDNIPVICSMLGYNYTKKYSPVNNEFHNGSIPNNLIQNLQCDGDEKDLQQCNSSPWEFGTNCSDINTASISCNTPIRLVGGKSWRSGRMELLFQENWIDVCHVDNSSSLKISKVICRMMGLSTRTMKVFNIAGNSSSSGNISCIGNEKDISMCSIQLEQCSVSSRLGISCETQIKLIKGRTDYMGSVSFHIDRRQEAIQYISNDLAADVVCKILGYNFTRYNRVQTQMDLRTSSACVYGTLKTLSCNGNETDIYDCKDSVWNPESYHCSSLYSGVNCQTPVRLSNGIDYQYGELEIMENDSWVPVCSQGFDLENAHVVCRMLGHKHVENTTKFREAPSQGPFVSGNIQCNGSEVDISECKNQWIKTNCLNSGVVVVDCRSKIRLENGLTKFKGRVEVFYKGKWGSICDSRSSQTAKVICKILGFNYAGAIVHSGRAFSNDSTQREYTIQNLNCVGTEDDITECPASDWKNGLNCYHNMPLEIECNTPVSLQSGSNENIGYVYVNYQQTSRSICGDNFTQNEADVICRKIGSETYQNATIYYENKFGYTYSYYPINELKCVGDEADLQECSSLPWNETTRSNCNDSNTVVSVNCRPSTPIRLNGTHNSGMVEINYQNTWGPICDDKFDIKDASVLCNMLGFKIGYRGTPIDTNDNVIIQYLQCDGTESDVSECSSARWYNIYNYDRCPETVRGEHLKATVVCSNDRVRLSDGVNDYQGRVEFQSIGIWGTICDENFNRLDAETVCRQVGFPSEKTATLYNSARFGSLYSSLVVDEMKCTGTENDLDECGSYPWAANSYTCHSGHSDAGVNCRPVTPLKLVNTTHKYSGRVEIEYKGSYGTICDRGFDENDAKVICRMKGFNPLSTIARKHAFYGAGSGRIIISDLQCNGDENDISECKTEYNYRWDNPYPYCTHAHDVSVQCNTPIRLRGGWTLYDGIVEIYINGSWTSVCLSGFTQVDAQTVCQLAGLNKNGTRPHNVTIFKGQYFGIKGTPTVGRLNCTGNEDDLYNCGTSKWTTEQYSCNPQNIAAINCQPVTKIRLMDGKSEVKGPTKETDTMKGRVEVFYNNEWGTVCDDQFDDSDAQVLCNMLGFPFGKVVEQTGYCKENKCGNIIIDDLNCLGIEKDISECNAREWGTHNCDHSEDVSIRCYSKVIDPCNASENVRLPNLELRYVNIDTTHLPKSINDSKLPFRWYNVGNNTMPIKLDSNNRCGAHLPIYSSFSVERIGANKTAKFKAVEVGNTDVSYDIEMKNCGEQFYVYKLRPTGSEESGYCFGVGSKETAPTFVPPSVSVSLVPSNRTVSFKCKFDPHAEKDFYYQVKWRVEDSSTKMLTKQFFKKDNLDGLKLTEDDFVTNDIGLGINISCAVRAYKSRDGLPGTLSSYSKASFFGIEVRTPYISLRNGETKSIELINYVPIICHTGNGEVDRFLNQGTNCDVRLQYFSPQYGTCSDGPSFKDGCDTHIANKDVGNIIHVNISSAEKGQYGVAGHFKVYLYVAAKDYMKLWSKTYKLPVISVDVLPEEQTDWRGAICNARNDPHMYTFDQRAYEHHEQSGEYSLYQHKIYKTVEIQHKIAPCTGDDPSAQCNCGLAVRAGRDVYVINVCDNLLVIGLTHCGDEALTIKKENDFTYTIYLPFGTAVRARIDNQPFAGHEGGKVLDISILPSVHDKGGNSRGLCGTLNNNTRDDFHHKDEKIGTINNRTEFIRSWKVLPSESLFSLQAVNARDLEPWVFPMCTCASETSNPLSCNRSISECTPGIRTGQHSCGEVSSRRSVRSLTKRPIIPIVRRTDHYARQHRIIRRESDERSWNREQATTHCREYFSNLKAFELCQKIPSTHTNISEENCILDILLTNSSKWTSISKQSMLDTCQTEIHRNASVRQVLIEKAKNATIAANTNLNIGTTLLPPAEINAIEQVEQIIQDITELSCLNNCSGNGACKNGTCSCNKGFGATDCSLDINRPPRLQAILDNGLCDENVSDCTHIYIFGEIFVGTNLTCKLQEFKMAVNETRKNTKVFHIKGIAESLIEAMCPIAHISTSRKRRSVTSPVGSQIDFVHGYEVSVSNDGLNYGNKTFDVYVFDSTCQTYNNRSVGMTFELKDGYCHIEGKCVQNGTLSMHQTMMCDTRMNKFNWTLKQTTTTERVTSPTTTSSFKTVNPNKTIAEIVKGEPDLAAYKIELTIDVKLDSSRDISKPNIYNELLNETKTSLMKYYREILGRGLKDVVIISLKSGSLIVKHAVIAKTDDFVIRAFSYALTGLSNGTQIELFGKSHSVSNVKIENRKVGVESEHFQDFLLCESYTQLHQCMEHEECVVVQGAATCKKLSQEASEGNTNMIIIISSTVGGVLVIVIFALVTVLCCKRKKNKNGLKNRRQTTVQNEYDGIPLDSVSRSGDRGKKHGHDNRAYLGESKDSAVDDMTLGSGSVYNDGSYVESKDGYIYYYGKSKQDDRL